MPVRRASDLLSDECDVTAGRPHPYVSRGGVKLAGALDAFGLDPAGLVCLDVGASTGGFTDVLLRRGAVRVHAVDVGRGQLHATLAADPRVISLEGTDIRTLDPARLAGPVAFATVDVSFISLRLVLPALAPFLADGARLVALIKPQFEAGRGRVGRGGIVRDDAVRQEVVADIVAVLAQGGWADGRTISSPIAGGDGNQEYLVTARWRRA